MRGKLQPTVRDNVIFELGMFMGALGQDHAFFIVPDGCGDIHLPTDIGGITYGTYEMGRSDGSWQQATGVFCARIRDVIKKHSHIDTRNQERLNDLSIAYACCEWIPDFNENDKYLSRWKRKGEVFCDMVEYCKSNPVNKRFLSIRKMQCFSDPNLNYLCEKIAFIAMVTARPEISDLEVIIGVPINSLTEGAARIQLLDAARGISDHCELHANLVKSTLLWCNRVSTTEDYVRKAQTLLRSSLARHTASA
jgi:hypothetical protein